MKLIKNIKSLFGVNWGNSLIKGNAMSNIPSLENAFLVINDGRIEDFGAMSSLPQEDSLYTEIIDASGKYVLPAWCDSHTHIVYAGSREGEFVDKIKGLTYQEIAAKGGGILNSAKILNDTPEDDLLEIAVTRLNEIRKLGTGAVEIKSGYSMTLEGEIKMLNVIQNLKKISPLLIKSTYLVHTFPKEFLHDKEGYVNQVVTKYIPKIAEEGLADFIDVFCEDGFYTEKQADSILECGSKYGMIPKVHANQLNNSGGVQAAVNSKAISADHLEQIGDHEIALLKASSTIPTLLPSAAFYLRLPYPPARKLIDEGLGFALATDYNPGSSPSGNMPLLLSISCIQMKITPQEAITAATINGAAAMNVGQEVGSIEKGKSANIIITKPMPSIDYLPYSFGSNLIEKVLIKGM